MGFPFEQVRRLTLGAWTDFFETYKKIHNIIVTQSTFREPRTVESLDSL